MSEMLKRVLNARVGDVLPTPTPLDAAPMLSVRVGRPVLLKREDLTPIFSFKIRGAYNRMAQLGPAERAAGVIAASAGNHAQGVAYCAAKLGIRCRIVMPRTTPAIKVDAVRRYGADVVLVGDDYAAAAVHCAALVAETGMTPIPPYDDLDVIAGQGTVAHRDPAPGAARPRRGLRAGRRRRARRRGRGGREGAPPRGAGDRRRARGLGRDGTLAARRRARRPRARRHLRRRRRRPPGRRAHLRALPDVPRRLHHRDGRRDLRRDQGRLRGHPLGARALGRARDRRRQARGARAARCRPGTSSRSRRAPT